MSMFRKAERKSVKLKILIEGPSGSGKTFGSLCVATKMSPGKVAFIDSEKDRSEYYADQFNFDKVSIEDANPAKYIEAIKAAAEAGYEFVIIDSLSHAWQNVLERKEKFDKQNPKNNQWTSWGPFTKEWDALVRCILDTNIHVIATTRSKQAHEQSVDANGKKSVVKLGLQAQIRDGTDYEFALVFKLSESHFASVSKDNTGLFGDPNTVWDLRDSKIPQSLAAWLKSGKEFIPSPPKPVQDESPLGKVIGYFESGTVKPGQPFADAVNRFVTRAMNGDFGTFADSPSSIVSIVADSVGLSEQQSLSEVSQEAIATACENVANWIKSNRQ